MSGIGAEQERETERSLRPLDKNPLRAPTIFRTLRSALAPRSAPLTCSAGDELEQLICMADMEIQIFCLLICF